MSDVRPVWLTRAQRDTLVKAAAHLFDRELTTVLDLCESWDSAPANAKNAAKAGCHDVLDGYVSACHSDEAAEAVLRSLGMLS